VSFTLTAELCSTVPELEKSEAGHAGSNPVAVPGTDTVKEGARWALRHRFITVGAVRLVVLSTGPIQEDRPSTWCPRDTRASEVSSFTRKATRWRRKRSFGEIEGGFSAMPGTSTASPSSAKQTGPVAKGQGDVTRRLAVLTLTNRTAEVQQFECSGTARELVAPKNSSRSCRLLSRASDHSSGILHHLYRFSKAAQLAQNSHSCVHEQCMTCISSDSATAWSLLDFNWPTRMCFSKNIQREFGERSRIKWM